MKYLLTSAGVKNRSIYNALLDLLGKPIAECSALCIPTAGYGHPWCGPDRAWNFISGKERECPMCELDHPALPENTLAAAERWAASLEGLAYAIDDQTAIKVVHGVVEIVKGTT